MVNNLKPRKGTSSELMPHIETIGGERDYDEALSQASNLMDSLSGPDGQEAAPHHPDAVELDRLVDLIAAYEEIHYPMAADDALDPR